jgi:hypothetical protein
MALNVPTQEFFGRDVTMGNISLNGSGPLAPNAEVAPGVTNEMHETAHTRQGEVLGPLYFPAYGLGAAIGGLRGDWHDKNPMETGPNQNPPRPWP